MNHNQRSLDYWPLFFLLAFLEATAAFVKLLLVPSEGSGLFGFSLARLGLLAILLAAMAVCGTLTFRARNKAFRSRWLDPSLRPRLYEILAPTFATLAMVAGIGSFLLRYYDPERMLPLFERLWPLLAFVIAFSVQSALWLLVIKRGIRKQDFPAGMPSLIASGILLLVFAFVALTKLGITPDPAYWGEPGIAIQGWQLGLTLLISLGFLALSFRAKTTRAQKIWIPLGLWLLATAVWLSVPNEVLRNSFYFPITPPANTPFPYSDSMYYDTMAQSLLIGHPYINDIPTRPLYIVLLAFLHWVFGENYGSIIVGQTALLAFVPVIFYFLGKKIHSAAAGVTIGLLAIFRELTGILVSSETRVSNTKMLLVDTPTLLLLLLACLFAFRWLERKDKLSALMAGGTFGMLLLLRTQSMLILPVVLVVAFLALRAEKRPWLAAFLIFILGVTVSIAPWLTHNYLRVGQFTFDAPFQYKVIASQYAYTGNLDLGNVDLEGKGLGGILITFALKDPGFVAGFIINHFLATEVNGLLALPLIFPFNGLRAPINLYWTTFNGSLAWYNLVLVFIYLAVIAVGFGAAWRRWRWKGLLPLAFSLGYALANGVGRFSGWRYDLPADWLAYFYFGVGVVEILTWMASLFGNKHELEMDPKEPVVSTQHPVFSGIAIAAVFAFISFIPWIAEGLSTPRYPETSQAALLAKLIPPDGIRTAQIEAFAAQPDAVLLEGRLLYPRLFPRNRGISSTRPWPAYETRAYPRMGFLVLNDSRTDVVFPIRNFSGEIPQAADVLILGCQRDGYVEARIVDISTEKPLTYLSDLKLTPCSP